MSDLINLFGLDFFGIIWNFVQSILNFFVTIYITISNFLAYLYLFNPIVATIFLLGICVGMFLGVLKIIKLIPMA